jgi:hypothetical protein
MDEETMNALDVGIPAYSVLGQGKIQPQCSGKDGQFCFFCAFEPQMESDGSQTEHPESLRSFVHALIAQKAETATIIQKVHEAYNDSVRAGISWRDPATGEMVDAPDWTLDSISAHLVHSSEFPLIFEDSIERVFHCLITSQNNTMMSETTGGAKTEVLDQFLKTVRALSQYRESRVRLDNLGSGRPNKRARDA